MKKVVLKREPWRTEEEASVEKSGHYQSRLQQVSGNLPLGCRESISGAIAASLPKAQKNVLMRNILKLEDLLRWTAKEENPAPDFSRLLRKESKTEKVKRLKEEAKKVSTFEQDEREIIANSVEEMIE